VDEPKLNRSRIPTAHSLLKAFDQL